MKVNQLIKRLEKIENKNSELIFYNLNNYDLEGCDFYDIIEGEVDYHGKEVTEFTVKKYLEKGE